MIKLLYEKYRQDIYYYLISLTHNQNVAEDLCSEVFVSAIKTLPNFQGRSDIKTWLFSIARHKWYEYIRKQKKNEGINDKLEIYFENEAYSIEDSTDRKEVVKKIAELLEKEKEQVKTIMFMRIEGYSFYEIGIKMGISESSARVIDFRARKKFREILEKEGYSYE